MPRVAVIVLDYFGAARTRACLHSLAGEPVNTVYGSEVCAVVNASNVIIAM